ncbi:MAG TPA: hypothetical protein VL172_11630 [Kofleriaceae bacterium]|nr:hypothetical protein [Kofleriaceae bacterium]
MKLIEAETTGPGETEAEPPPVPLPPRPRRRRVSVSLLLTLLVLAATVTTVYLIFPERHNALIEAGFRLHRESDPELEIDHPTDAELAAWGVAAVGRDSEWPRQRDGIEVIGVRTATVLNRRVAVVHYKVKGDAVTILVQRPRDAVPRTLRRTDGDDKAVLWRRGKQTFVAVGPAATYASWGPAIGVP